MARYFIRIFFESIFFENAEKEVFAQLPENIFLQRISIFYYLCKTKRKTHWNV